jgi:hypothetical protein
MDMTGRTRSSWTDAEPAIEAAPEEARALILRRFPEASFTVAHGDDANGTHFIPIVDVDNLGEVTAVGLGRVLDLQVEEELPMYVIPDQPLERVLARLRDERALAAMTVG